MENNMKEQISEEMKRVNERVEEWSLSRKISNIDPSVIERNMEDQGGLVDRKEDNKKIESARKVVKTSSNPDLNENYWTNMENFGGVPTGSASLTIDNKKEKEADKKIDEVFVEPKLDNTKGKAYFSELNMENFGGIPTGDDDKPQDEQQTGIGSR